ncbi:hypothetical protein Aph02nite_30250 [Actinoplanes philippinensis]|nr:hypothetical protein Aph02nite_30250 [Actinoplanes philippinensis]
MPYFGALITMCLITGRSWVYTVSFGVVLVVTVAVAARSLRRVAGGRQAVP